MNLDSTVDVLDAMPSAEGFSEDSEFLLERFAELGRKAELELSRLGQVAEHVSVH